MLPGNEGVPGEVHLLQEFGGWHQSQILKLAVECKVVDQCQVGSNVDG